MFPLNEIENGRTLYGKFIAFTKEAAIERNVKKKIKITHVTELSKHMDIEKTVSGLT